MDGGHWVMKGGRGDTSEGQVLRSVKEGRREAELQRWAVWPWPRDAEGSRSPMCLIRRRGMRYSYR